MLTPFHRLPLSDFLKKKTINYFLNTLVSVSNFPTFIREPLEREPFFASSSPPTPELCTKLQECAKAEENCRSFFHQAIHQAVWDAPYIAECPMGLKFSVAPLVFCNGASTGVIISGFVRSRPWSEKEITLLNYCCRKLNTNRDDIYELAKKIPIVSEERIEIVADFNHNTAQYLMKFSSLKRGNYEDYLSSNYAIARELLQETNKDKGEKAAINHRDSLDWQEEKKLIELVALGKRSSAEKQLEKIFARLYVKYKNQPMEFKGRIMELAVTITRSPLYYTYYSDGEPVNIRYPEFYPPKGYNKIALRQWLMVVLEQVLDVTDDKTESKFKAKIVRATMGYISSNLNNKLKVDEVAQEMGFSPQHLNRLFIDEVGITACEYITKTKLQEAKRLLTETDMSISKISDKLNYWDSTHFAKTFRKMTGVTPSEFRKNTSLQS